MYTDTTDAWRLRNHKERLLINFAGILTELHLALIATFIWGILPEGGMKSVMFFIATTSWISSLLINVSPFMRFDGYYVFADWLKAENLQPRSFALARWQVRDTLFGLNHSPPEELNPSRRWLFIIYAWSTWIYRFFLFIGIALLVYHFAFKFLNAWKKVMTGYPIVDAGMREVYETGWMHNRIRMVVGSCLVKHLRINWKEGEKYVRSCLLDCNEANNVAQWQWVAGCGADAAPYFRIFNPILQGEKFDKQGEYVKKWVPELERVPSKFIHKPWELDLKDCFYFFTFFDFI